ncbi:hypothetical protein [Rhizobium miluonense]|uniref:Uncharacterized protein n=1 Tax=Rhizobium miluonense TaxID=411945 RepID=A0A1C3XDT9_9HYPH|nr:hypothetical protein [Rhizobium miluonense]SCB50134.1 hypothetical protein GA0061102_10844 [Rhizobium miluonense]
MTNEQSLVRRQRPLLAAVVLLIVFWYLLAVPLFIATKVYGYGFVPSAEWISKINGFGIAAGLVSGIFLCGFMFSRSDTIPGGDLKKTVTILFSPLFGFVLGRTTCVMTIPVLLSIVAGHHVELSFIVEDAAGHSEKACSLPVALRDLPIFFNQLCGVSNDLRGTLRPGTRLIVEGHGTRFGIYATSFHNAAP